MNDTNDRFKRAKVRKKAAPVKHVVVSDEAKKAYETIVRERDEWEREYGQHLTDERKR